MGNRSEKSDQNITAAVASGTSRENSMPKQNEMKIKSETSEIAQPNAVVEVKKIDNVDENESSDLIAVNEFDSEEEEEEENFEEESIEFSQKRQSERDSSEEPQSKRPRFIGPAVIPREYTYYQKNYIHARGDTVCLEIGYAFNEITFTFLVYYFHAFNLILKKHCFIILAYQTNAVMDAIQIKL